VKEREFKLQGGTWIGMFENGAIRRIFGLRGRKLQGAREIAQRKAS